MKPQAVALPETVEVSGIAFASTELAEASDTLIQFALAGKAYAIRLANAFCIVSADKDPEYRAVLTGPGINFPDGLPVSILMRIKQGWRKSAARQIRGPSLFAQTIERSQTYSGIRHFFLGATPSVLNDLEETVKTKYPRAVIAGSYAPPFEALSSAFADQCATHIVAAKPNVVWVGLGTPKQDFLAQELVARTGATCIGVGAAFDFFSGHKSEAPRWLQACGLEWLYRLLTEPRRLWKRYLIGNVHFIRLALGELLWKNKSS